MNFKQGVPTAIALSVLAFAALVISVVGALVYAGKDPAPVITFTLAVIPATVGVIVTVKQNGDIKAGVDEVATQVNGKLDAKFRAIHDRMDAIPGVPTAATLNIETPDKMGENSEQDKPATS